MEITNDEQNRRFRRKVGFRERTKYRKVLCCEQQNRKINGGFICAIADLLSIR